MSCGTFTISWRALNERLPTTTCPHLPVGTPRYSESHVGRDDASARLADYWTVSLGEYALRSFLCVAVMVGGTMASNEKWLTNLRRIASQGHSGETYAGSTVLRLLDLLDAAKTELAQYKGVISDMREDGLTSPMEMAELKRVVKILTNALESIVRVGGMTEGTIALEALEQAGRIFASTSKQY